MNENVKAFLKDVKDLLNDCEFNKIYLKCRSELQPFEVGEFTSMLLACNINPLLYMHEVPDFFLYENKNIESIAIPNNIKDINVGAFSRSQIKEISIPSSVMQIRMNAFGQCDHLEKIHLEDIAKFTSIKFMGRWSNPFYSKRHLFYSKVEGYYKGMSFTEMGIYYDIPLRGISSFDSFYEEEPITFYKEEPEYLKVNPFIVPSPIRVGKF